MYPSESMLSFRTAPRAAHGDLIEVGGRPVRLSINARARRVSLRLDSARREVIATAPSGARLKEAVAFAHAREAWIAARLDALPRPLAFDAGAELTVGGFPCRLERAAMRITPRLIPPTPHEPARLVASGEGEAFARAVRRALKAEALRLLTDRTAHYAAKLDRPMPAVAVMEARARWGSCRPATARQAASIRYVWRLILAPPSVMDYVAAHECAHLIEANHGPRFWALVKRLYGDPAPAKGWLRAHGQTLHAAGG